MAYWMISDRNLPASGPQSPASFGDNRGDLTFWTATAGPVADPSNWTPVSRANLSDPSERRRLELSAYRSENAKYGRSEPRHFFHSRF